MNAHAVRPATPKDHVALQELFSAAIARAHWLPSTSRARADLASVTQNELILVHATDDDQILGFISVYAPEHFVHHLFVAPGFEDKGIGTNLLIELPRYVAPPWRLKCLTANSRAMSFYSRRGWAEVERREGPEGQYALLEKHEA